MSKFKVSHEKDHHDKHPVKQEVVLSCGTGSGVALPSNSGVPVLIGAPQSELVVGIVTLDTRDMEKPSVKIDFSSVVNFLAEVNLGGVFISLLFTLKKICDGDKIPLGTWTYQKAVSFGFIQGAVEDGVQVNTQVNGGVEIDFRESFGFTWCECQDCPDCCTYIIEVADFQSYNVQCASITNVSVSALAVGC